MEPLINLKSDVTWFYFVSILFVHKHSAVVIPWFVVKIKHVDCKISTKNVNNYK